LDAPCRHRRVDHEYGGRDHCKRYRRKVLLRVVRRFGVETWVHDKGAIRNEYCIAVGSGPRRLARADVAGGTGDILNIELLSEMLGEFLSGDPREDISAAAGSEWHNHTHRPRWISLRPYSARRGRQRGCARNQMQDLSTAERFQRRSLSPFTQLVTEIERCRATFSSCRTVDGLTLRTDGHNFHRTRNDERDFRSRIRTRSVRSDWHCIPHNQFHK